MTGTAFKKLALVTGASRGLGFAIAEADLKNAYCSVMTGNGGAYIKSLFDLDDICFKPIRETTQLAPDLTLFIQESHTPGVIGLLLGYIVTPGKKKEDQGA